MHILPLPMLGLLTMVQEMMLGCVQLTGQLIGDETISPCSESFLFSHSNKLALFLSVNPSGRKYGCAGDELNPRGCCCSDASSSIPCGRLHWVCNVHLLVSTK